MKKYLVIYKEKLNTLSKREIFLHAASLLLFISLFIFGLWAYKRGLFHSLKEMNQVIRSMGIWAPLLFISLQIAQIVIPFVPGSITNVVGVVLFGPIMGTIYNYLGNFIGSHINFFLTRFYGTRILSTLSGNQNYQKYRSMFDIHGKFEKFFNMAIFFPFFPDDFLCLVAGLSKMTRFQFTRSILLFKPWSIISYGVLYHFFAGYFF